MLRRGLLHGAALDAEHRGRAAQLRQTAITRAQSITPSPQAQPTGVPVTLPRSASDCATEMSLAWRWTRRSLTCSSQAIGSSPAR